MSALPSRPTNSNASRGAARYRDAVRAAIRPYTCADLEDIVAFRREMYGGSSIYADRDYVEWMYSETAAGASAGRRLWLYRKNGKIEGQQGGLPVTLEVHGRGYPALWALDLMVSPEFQLRGIGVVLAETAYNETGLLLGTEVSADARRAFLRAGWADCGTIPLYMRPLDVSRLVRARTTRRTARVLGAGGTVGLRVLDRALLSILRLRGLRLEAISEFDERSDQLWARVSRHFPVACRRDAAFLNWRFASFPAARYRMYYAYHGREMVGHLVLRTGEWNALPAGFIIDFACSPEWSVPLLGAALDQLRQEPLAAVYCLHLHPGSTNPLSALGFFRRDSGWPFMYRARDLPPAARSAVADPRSWFLTAADSDLDRPREGTVFTTSRSWATPGSVASIAQR